MPITNPEIEKRFTYHPPKDERQVKVYQAIRDNLRGMANMIDAHCPDSREKSLALTKLEEACMWANAAIARNS